MVFIIAKLTQSNIEILVGGFLIIAVLIAVLLLSKRKHGSHPSKIDAQELLEAAAKDLTGLVVDVKGVKKNLSFSPYMNSAVAIFLSEIGSALSPHTYSFAYLPERILAAYKEFGAIILKVAKEKGVKLSVEESGQLALQVLIMLAYIQIFSLRPTTLFRLEKIGLEFKPTMVPGGIFFPECVVLMALSIFGSDPRTDVAMVSNRMIPVILRDVLSLERDTIVLDPFPKRLSLGNIAGHARGIAINPVTGVAYLAKQGLTGAQRVYEFGGASRSVSLADPPLQLAITADGSFLCVVHDAALGLVSVVDTQTMTSVGTIHVGAYPQAIAIAEEVPKAFVTNGGENTVSVILTNTNAVMATIPVGDGPLYVAVTPDGKRAYVANRNSNDVSVIDTRSLVVVATVPVGTVPAGLAASRDGQRIYVANSGSSSISVIDRVTSAVIDTIATPPVPYTIAFHPIRDEFWVGFNTVGTVLQVYSAADYSVLALRSSGDHTYASTGLAFTPDGSEAYGSEGCGLCGRFNRLSGNHPGGTVDVIQPDILYDDSGHARGVAVNPVTGVVYMAKQGQIGSPFVYEFGGPSRSVNFTDPPLGVAVNREGAFLYVVNDAILGTVSVVNTQTMTTAATIPVGLSPYSIAIADTRGATTFAKLYPGLDPAADANRNGLTNYGDYAAGVEPAGVPDASARLTIGSQNGNLQMQYTRRTNAADNYSRFEKSTDLFAWTPMLLGDDYLIENSATTAPNRVQITVRTLFSPGVPSQYWRQVVFTVP